jgi:uncharacterized protein
MSEGLIRDTADYVRQKMLGESSGHDWWHVYRVWQTALKIGSAEGADLTVVQLGALLHDIADWKFHDGDTEIGPKVARAWLERCQADARTVDLVSDVVASVSFKGAGVADAPLSKEAEVVQDADRLDAIGAVGIARTFAYGGAHGREMYNPEIRPVLHNSAESYIANSSPTINHFHEKLLLLKDRMKTASGRRIADARHEYMLGFLDRFHHEWAGEA